MRTCRSTSAFAVAASHQHIVTIAPDGHLHGAEAWILGGAVTLLMLALTTIGATSERAQHDDQRARRLTIQYAVALTPLVLAPLADAAPLVSIVGAMATLCLSPGNAGAGWT